MPLAHEDLTHAIIGAAIEVHRALGPGFIESIYANALRIELEHHGIEFLREVLIPVVYRGHEVGMHKLDLFVSKTLVVELKAIKRLEDIHFAIVRSYLRAAGVDHGLIMNFAGPTLQIKRVIASSGPKSVPGFMAS